MNTTETQAAGERLASAPRHHVPASDLVAGDVIYHQGAVVAIDAITDHAKARSIELVGHGRIRPRKTTLINRLEGVTRDDVDAAGADRHERVRKALTGGGANGASASAGALREGSTMSAIITVLKAARGALTANEVLERIRKRDLAPGLKGKTPEQTIAARMATAAKAGKHGIIRTEPGKYTYSAPVRK